MFYLWLMAYFWCDNKPTALFTYSRAQPAWEAGRDFFSPDWACSQRCPSRGRCGGSPRSSGREPPQGERGTHGGCPLASGGSQTLPRTTRVAVGTRSLRGRGSQTFFSRVSPGGRALDWLCSPSAERSPSLSRVSGMKISRWPGCGRREGPTNRLF